MTDEQYAILEDKVVDAYRGEIHEYIEFMRTQGGTATGYASMSQLEALLQGIGDNSRHKCLELTADLINGINERELIAAKKENTQERG